MFSFFSRKKEKERELDLKFAHLEEEIRKIDEWADPKKIERYILDSCEQIVATTKEIEEEKKEYRHLTNYLNDIRKIENLTDVQVRELKEAANQIERLDKARERFKNENRLLDNLHYRLMAQNAPDVPATIERMQENEVYQDRIKKRMNALEAERTRLTMDKEEYEKKRKQLKLFSVGLLVLMAVLFVLLFYFRSHVGDAVSWIMLFLALAVSCGATYVFVRLSHSNRKSRKNVRLLNETINLINRVRLRYANVTKAVNYVQEKFRVNSAAELNYYWSRYLLELKRQEQFEKDNSDLEYYTRRFYGTLDDLELYNKTFWNNQFSALIEPAELEKLKNSLVERRSKTRNRMAESTKAVKSERDEIDRLMYEHNYYVPEIMEVIATVDKFCGFEPEPVKATDTVPKKSES